MAYDNNLVKNIQKDHDESLALIRQLRETLLSRRKKDAREIFGRLNEALARHFEFEVNYLYPRMRRLILETTDKLRARQEQIRTAIKESLCTLDKNKVNKNRLPTIKDTLDMISGHLKNCSGIVSLANGFGKEEEDELNQRFKEFCGLNGLRSGERGVRR